MRGLHIRFMNTIALAAVGICASAVAMDEPVTNDATKPPAADAAPVAGSNEIAVEPVPTVQQVIDRALEAMGGREAIAKIESMCVRWETPGNPGYASENCFAASDKILIVDRKPTGKNVHGSDGRIGWLEMYDREYFYQTFYHDTKVFKGMAFSRMLLPCFEEFLKTAERPERVDFNGQPAYQLIVPEMNMTPAAVYFSVNSGLPLGHSAVATAQEPDAPMRYRLVLADWKPVGDIRFPHHAVVTNPVASGEQRVTSIEINTIDPAIFTAPEKKPSKLPDQPKRGQVNPPSAAALLDLSAPLTAEQIATLSRQQTRDRIGAIARELRVGEPESAVRERLEREFKLLMERLRQLPKQT